MIHKKMLIALLLLSAVGSSVQARSLTAIKQDGTLHIGTSGDMPPFSYTVGGVNTGFEVDLLSMIAADLGVKVDFTVVPVDGALTSFTDRNVDVMVGGLGITSTRENKVDFTQAYLCLGMSVVARDPAIQTRFDLENKNIGVLSGSTIQGFVAKLPFPKKTVVLATTNEVIFAVATGKVDASLAYTLMAPVMAKLYPKSGVHFGPVQWSVPVGAMVARNDASLRLALNRGLNKVVNDGRYAQLSSKYLGSDARCKAATP